MKHIQTARPKLTIHRETLRKLSKEDLTHVAGGVATRTCTYTHDDCPSGDSAQCPTVDTIPQTHIDDGKHGLCNTVSIEGNG
jgi:hypothetical protein